MELSALTAGFVKSFLLTLATILPILNPPATVPVFLNVSEEFEPRQRPMLARTVALNVTLMLGVAMLIGVYVLDFFGVSIAIVRVAGGLIVAFTAWGMLYTREAERTGKAQMARALVDDNNVRIRAFYPITFPLTCGPGSISAVITVGAALHSPHLSLAAANFAGGLTGLMAIGLMVLVTYRYAGRLLRPLGEVGLVVMLRLSAFILLCVGVQIFWDGAKELLHGLYLGR